MNIKILGVVTGLLLSGLASSEELRFSNDIPWMLGLGPGLRVDYFLDSSVSTVVHEAPVRFSNNKFNCDFQDGPVKTAMLFHGQYYVCNLRKDKRGKWHVPRLSNITFDLGAVQGLKAGMLVSFCAKDPTSGFVESMTPGRTISRLIDCGSVVEVALLNPGDMKDFKDIGVFLVADADHGVVTLAGDPHSNWSMKISWSSSGTVSEPKK